jgi:hypothetical protein
MNGLQRIFAVPHEPSSRAKPPGPPPAAAGGGGATSGTNVFLSPESLATFPGATLGAGAIWALSKIVFKDTSEQVLAMVAAFIIGTIVFLIGISTQGSQPKNAGAWALAFLVAFINSVLLATTVLGIPVMAGKNQSQTTQTKASTPTAAPASTPGVK